MCSVVRYCRLAVSPGRDLRRRLVRRRDAQRSEQGDHAHLVKGARQLGRLRLEQQRIGAQGPRLVTELPGPDDLVHHVSGEHRASVAMAARGRRSFSCAP
jgi:hypothetical protein